MIQDLIIIIATGDTQQAQAAINDLVNIGKL